MWLMIDLMKETQTWYYMKWIFFFILGGAKTDYILNTKISLWYSIVYLRIESFSTIEHLTEKEDNIIYFNQHAIKLSNVECISVNIISNSIEMREN